MYERKIPKELDCGMGVIMDIIGGKWKPCLIFNIMSGQYRPSQLQALNPLATRKVLNQQLKELQEHGVITKTILPPKVEYHLTELGESLLPVIKMMDQWGASYMSNPTKIPVLEKELM